LFYCHQLKALAERTKICAVGLGNGGRKTKEEKREEMVQKMKKASRKRQAERGEKARD